MSNGGGMEETSFVSASKARSEKKQTGEQTGSLKITPSFQSISSVSCCQIYHKV